MRGLFGTVGVAPGTYTLQLGAPVVCPPDGWGTGAYGVPRVGWYDEPNNYYGFQPAQMLQPGQLFDPYGTDSKLSGITDSPPTLAGIRLDILGVVLGVAAIAAIGIGFFTTR